MKAFKNNVYFVNVCSITASVVQSITWYAVVLNSFMKEGKGGMLVGVSRKIRGRDKERRESEP